MKESLQKYIQSVDKIISSRRNSDNLNEIIGEHQVKIGFYQHERLIHLIVTCLFSILTIGTFLYSINNFSIEILLLFIVFVSLLIPYIFHYYFLENGVQKLYQQYDKLKAVVKKNNGRRN